MSYPRITPWLYLKYPPYQFIIIRGGGAVHSTGVLAHPNYLDYVIVNLDMTLFPENAQVIFFAVIGNDTAGAETSLRLYNYTDGLFIAGSDLKRTGVGRDYLESGDLRANFPTGEKEYTLSLKTDTGATNASVWIAGLKIVFP